MTFSNTTNRTQATGTGSIGQQIAFSFPAAATSDIVCYKRVTATGVETTLVETTNYTIALTGDTGGTVTTVTAVETTEQIHVVRATPQTQELNLQHGGTFSAEDQEDAFDKQTKIAIDVNGKTERSIRFPETDPSSSIDDLPSSVDRAGYVLGFNSSTGAPEAVAVSSITPVPVIGDVQLLSTTTVSFAADADTVLYTVPAGTRLLIHHLMIVAADDAGATTTISCGQDGAETDFLPVTELSNLDAQYDAVIAYPPAGMVPMQLKSYAAATVIEAQVASNSGAAGNTVYLYGILYAV